MICRRTGRSSLVLDILRGLPWCADGAQIKNLRGISAAAIEAKMPHKGITIDDIGGSAGAQAMADFLGP
jgi:hypothetical protein